MGIFFLYLHLRNIFFCLLCGMYFGYTFPFLETTKVIFSFICCYFWGCYLSGGDIFLDFTVLFANVWFLHILICILYAVYMWNICIINHMCIIHILYVNYMRINIEIKMNAILYTHAIKILCVKN